MLKFQLHIPIKQTQKLLPLLLAETSLSKTQLIDAINKGALWLERKGKIKRSYQTEQRVSEGTSVHFYFHQALLEQQITSVELIADFHDYSIWYKPYGVLCQASKWCDHLTIKRLAEQQIHRPCTIQHRLDKAATGLILLSHSKAANQHFTQLFEQKRIKKQYHIIVHGQFPETTISCKQAIDDKSAVSHFTKIDENQAYSLVSVDIETGRKHQIRRHAQYLGFPIVGDRLYGEMKQQIDQQLNLQLCAVQLTFADLQGQSQQVRLPTRLQLSLPNSLQYCSKL